MLHGWINSDFVIRFKTVQHLLLKKIILTLALPNEFGKIHVAKYFSSTKNYSTGMRYKISEKYYK